MCYCDYCNKELRKPNYTVGYSGDKEETWTCFSCMKDCGDYYFCNSCRVFTYYEAALDNGYFCGNCNKSFNIGIVDVVNMTEDDYDGQGKFHFFKGTKVVNTNKEIEGEVFFGIELEIERNKNIKSGKVFTLNDFNTIFGNKARFGYDGSLRQGVEIKSNPMTFDGIYRSKIWDKFFQKVSRSKYFDKKNKNAGIHIHICNNAFRDGYVQKIADFFREYREVVEAFAERQMNDYCLYNGDVYDKYAAINYSENYDTVEIRIFQSVLDKISFFKNIEFVRALIAYGDKYPKLEKIDLARFIKMIAKDHKLYPNLIKFMKKNEVLNNLLKDTRRKFKIVVYSKDLKGIPARFNKIKCKR